MKKFALVCCLLTLAACARNGHTEKNPPLPGTSVADNEVEATTTGSFMAAYDNEELASLPLGSYFQIGQDIQFSGISLKPKTTNSKANGFDFWRLLQINGTFFYGGITDKITDVNTKQQFSVSDLISKNPDSLFISWWTPKSVEVDEATNTFVVKGDQKFSLRPSRHPENNEIVFHLDESCFRNKSCGVMSRLAITGPNAIHVNVAQLKTFFGPQTIVMKPGTPDVQTGSTTVKTDAPDSTIAVEPSLVNTEIPLNPLPVYK